MMIHLSHYDGKFRIVSFAKNDMDMNRLLNRDLSVAYINNGQLSILPDTIDIPLEEAELSRFDYVNSYDVFEINEKGIAYRCFDCSSYGNTVVVTNQCNCNCLMCPTPESMRNNHYGYSGHELISIAKHFPSDTPYITITGGEPFMIRKGLFDYLLYLRENLSDTEYQLLTNGRVFCSKEYTEEFKRTRPPKMVVGIPIHGHNAELHDGIVQSKGAFKETVSGIKNLITTKANVELRIVVSKLNYLHIKDIAELIVAEFPEAYCVKVMGLEMTGNAAKNADMVWIDYQTAFNYSKAGIDKLIKSGIDVGLYNFPLCSVDKAYWGICEKSISPDKVRYTPQCDDCYVKDACGGIFAGTIRLINDSVKAISKND